MNGRVRMRHFPGKKLPPGASFTSKVALVGVAPPGGGRDSLPGDVRARSPRKGLLVSTTPSESTATPECFCWTLHVREMLGTMDLLEKWRKRGAKLDYYVPDVGW